MRYAIAYTHFDYASSAASSCRRAPRRGHVLPEGLHDRLRVRPRALQVPRLGLPCRAERSTRRHRCSTLPPLRPPVSAASWHLDSDTSKRARAATCCCGVSGACFVPNLLRRTAFLAEPRVGGGLHPPRLLRVRALVRRNQRRDVDTTPSRSLQLRDVDSSPTLRWPYEPRAMSHLRRTSSRTERCDDGYQWYPTTQNSHATCGRRTGRRHDPSSHYGHYRDPSVVLGG